MLWGCRENLGGNQKRNRATNQVLADIEKEKLCEEELFVSKTEFLILIIISPYFKVCNLLIDFGTADLYIGNNPITVIEPGSISVKPASTTTTEF